MAFYSPAQWRCFDRCLIGLKKFKRLGLRIRFLTLTLPACNAVYKPGVRSLFSGESEPLLKDLKLSKALVQVLWRILYLRLCRLTVVDLVCDGYLDVGRAEDLYGDDWHLVDFANVPYFSVHTSEGNGVLHCVLACDYIPFEWIMENWVEIAGTCYIFINDPYSSKRRRFRRGTRSEADVAHYLMAQYVGIRQPDFVYGWSRNWVYKGFTKDYAELRRVCKDYSKVYVNRYGLEWYPVDYRKLWVEWEKMVDDKVFGVSHKLDGFDEFMGSVRSYISSPGDYGVV